MTGWKAVAYATLLVAAGCITKENTNNPPYLPEFDKTYTLQGAISDAVTGARLGGSDLKVFLIQGADVRTPTRLNTDPNDPLVGEYAFSGIPADVNVMGVFSQVNKAYKVVAIKPGYQRFEAEVSFAAAYYQLPGAYEPTTPVLDTVYNRIGNIFMFPVGVSSPGYEFTVTYNGTPVPGATVLLDPDYQAGNIPLPVPLDILIATGGTLASLAATTDAAGKATFAGSLLSLGAAYSAQVLPVRFTGSAGTEVPLARYVADKDVIVGLSDVDQHIALTDLLPGGGNYVYVVSASNQALGQITPSGRLDITFSAPVGLLNPTGFSMNYTGTLADLGDPQYQATLSTDGRVLTLQPNFVGAAPTMPSTSVTFSDGSARVVPLDYPSTSYQVFADLHLADGITPPSGTVQVKGP